MWKKKSSDAKKQRSGERRQPQPAESTPSAAATSETCQGKGGGGSGFGRIAALRRIGKVARIRQRRSGTSDSTSFRLAAPSLQTPVPPARFAAADSATAGSRGCPHHAFATRLDTILEEVTPRASRANADAESEDFAEATTGAGSSSPSDEFSDLNTAEVFGESTEIRQVSIEPELQSDTPTFLSQSVQATAGSNSENFASNRGHEPSSEVKLEAFNNERLVSETPRTQTTDSNIGPRFVHAADLNTMRSPLLEQRPPNTGGSAAITSTTGNFLLDDPVIRGFLSSEPDASGWMGNSGGSDSISFDAPTRDDDSQLSAAREGKVWIQDPIKTIGQRQSVPETSVRTVLWSADSKSATQSIQSLSLGVTNSSYSDVLLSASSNVSGSMSTQSSSPNFEWEIQGTKGNLKGDSFSSSEFSARKVLVRGGALGASSRTASRSSLSAVDNNEFDDEAQDAQTTHLSRLRGPMMKIPKGISDLARNKKSPYGETSRPQQNYMLQYLQQKQKLLQQPERKAPLDSVDKAEAAATKATAAAAAVAEQATAASTGYRRYPDRLLNLDCAQRVQHCDCLSKLCCPTVRRTGRVCPEQLVDYRVSLRQLMRLFMAEQQISDCCDSRCCCPAVSHGNCATSSSCCGGGCASGGDRCCRRQGPCCRGQQKPQCSGGGGGGRSCNCCCNSAPKRGGCCCCCGGGRKSCCCCCPPPQPPSPLNRYQSPLLSASCFPVCRPACKSSVALSCFCAGINSAASRVNRSDQPPSRGGGGGGGKGDGQIQSRNCAAGGGFRSSWPRTAWNRSRSGGRGIAATDGVGGAGLPPSTSAWLPATRWTPALRVNSRERVSFDSRCVTTS